MKVAITSIFEIDGAPVATFDSALGSGVAVLGGSYDPGFVGQQMSVEFDIDAPASINGNAAYSDNSVPTICSTPEGVELVGAVESQDEDGMAYLRLSEECLIMVDVLNKERLDIGRMLRMNLKMTEMRMTPIW
jgi:hypothetical protein